MYKIIWMSDPHYTQQGEVLGHNPRFRIKAAVDYINTHHTDADICVITGDLVNHGTLTDYEGLSDHLQQLRIPFLPLMGNHDQRQLLRQTLPLPTACMTDFIQYKVSTPRAELLCLDTHKTGSSAGEFCEARYQWLEDTLSSTTDKPVYLFLHHPPMPLGLPMQDIDRMEHGERFLDLIARFDCISYLFIGHVHRPVTGVVNGIPYATMRSILLQAPPPRPAWDWESFKPAAEAPNLGVVTVTSTGVSVQYEQFCSFESGAQADVVAQ